MTRTTVASLPDTSTLYQLYDIMAVITHLNPSFHPVAERVRVVLPSTSLTSTETVPIGRWCVMVVMCVSPCQWLWLMIDKGLQIVRADLSLSTISVLLLS